MNKYQTFLIQLKTVSVNLSQINKVKYPSNNTSIELPVQAFLKVFKFWLRNLHFRRISLHKHHNM